MPRERLTLSTIRARANVSDKLLKQLTSGALNPASVDDEQAINYFTKTMTAERDKWADRLRAETQ